MLTIKIGRNWCKRKQSFFRWKPLQQRSSGFTISSELTLQKHHVDVVLKDHVVRMVNRVLHSLLVFRPTKELYWIKQQERKRETFLDQKITSPINWPYFTLFFPPDWLTVHRTILLLQNTNYLYSIRIKGSGVFSCSHFSGSCALWCFQMNDEIFSCETHFSLLLPLAHIRTLVYLFPNSVLYSALVSCFWYIFGMWFLRTTSHDSH